MGIICAPAAAGSKAEAKKKRLLCFSNQFQPLRPRNRAIRNAGAAHNAAGPNLSRSTNRSATGKSEKDNKHQQPEQDVSHNRCPFPCGHCEQIHPDKQAKNVPAATAAGFRHRASGFRFQEKERIERHSPDPHPLPCGLGLVACGCFASSLDPFSFSLRH
jgi:hypothetical protein